MAKSDKEPANFKDWFEETEDKNFLEEERARQKEIKEKTVSREEDAPKPRTAKRKKMGRPSYKNPNVEYVSFGITIPIETKKALKIALVTTFDGKYNTQEEFINAAILEKLKRGK